MPFHTVRRRTYVILIISTLVLAALLAGGIILTKDRPSRQTERDCLAQHEDSLRGVPPTYSAMQLSNCTAGSSTDAHTRDALLHVVRSVTAYMDNNDVLPTNVSDAGVSLPTGISYTRTADTRYTICATFEAASKNQANYAGSGDVQQDLYDSNIESSGGKSFISKGPGKQCFGIIVYAPNNVKNGFPPSINLD